MYVAYRLAALQDECRDRPGAEELVRHAAPFDDANGLCRLILLREARGDRKGAEDLARQCIEQIDVTLMRGLLPRALSRLWPYRLNPDGAPTPRWQPST
ncbi:hypothetical protein ACFXPT_36620 [Streptomyces goshikiensis]|uniref:hypothetical protein n=1 Tax=Streptomyces goshikiensis TaxID=1942 RepID=UPI0036883C0C